MNGRIGSAALAAALLLVAGCRREDKIKLEPTDESSPALASTVHAADPKTAMQLLKGFHGVEHNSWRWTTGNFAVTLKPPVGASDRGGTLIVKFSLPEAVLTPGKTVALSASLHNSELGKQSYKAAGEHTFNADVPAKLLGGDAATFAFAVDGFLPAGTVDARELGIVFVSAGLESK